MLSSQEQTSQSQPQSQPQSQSQGQTQGQSQGQPQEPKLVDMEVTDQNSALNIMVSFLSLANKRGVFSLDESAKIWECIKKFKITE